MSIDWPCTPNAEGDVPSILQIAGEPDLTQHALLLMTGTKEWAERTDGVLESFQVPVQTKGGPISLPCLGFQGEQPVAILSHSGPWTSEDHQRVFVWAAKLRTNEQLRPIRIELICDEEPPPAIREVLSHEGACLFAVVANPFWNPDKPSKNAAVFRSVWQQLYEEEPGLDRAGVELVQRELPQRFGPVSDTNSLKVDLNALLGAYLGEAIMASGGAGQWADAPPPYESWQKILVAAGGALNPMGRASKFLRDSSQGLLPFFDAATSGDDVAALSRDGRLDGMDARLAERRAGSLEGLSLNAKRRIYKALAHVARRSDGASEHADEVVLTTYANLLGLNAEAPALRAEALSKQSKLQLGGSEAEQEALLNGLVDLATADGELDDRERRRLRRIFTVLGVDADGVFAAIDAQLG
jgi:hypothetical protein